MTKEVVDTKEINEELEIEIYLENGIYYLLLKSLLENAEELEPIAAGENLEIVESIVRFAVAAGMFTKTEKLIELISSKIFREVYDLPGTTVLNMSDIAE